MDRHLHALGPRFPHRHRVTTAVFPLLALAACSGTPRLDEWDAAVPDGGHVVPQPDASRPDAARPDAARPDAARPDASVPDASHPDAAVPDAALPDANLPDAWLPDADQPDAAVPDAAVPDAAGLPSWSTPAAEILQQGTQGFLLHGTLLLPDGVLDQGDVLVTGAFITCVAEDCKQAAGAQDATWIDTHGVISPGLVDSHNHLSYDFFPEWVPSPPRFFSNRYEWADDPTYEAHVLPYTKHRSNNTHFCPGSKWGELRAVMHGATTMLGIPSAAGSCINWGIRNADSYHGLGYDYMNGTIGSPRDVDDATAARYQADFTAENNPVTRFHVHMQEGFAGNNILDEFDSFAGRDTRSNRHAGTSLLYPGTGILIHSVSLTESQLTEAWLAGAKVVWSPSSNLVLYNRTAPIQRILQLGITTGLGPDWTLSGEDEMLSEMRAALAYGEAQGIPEITPRKVWEMATVDGAKVVGLENHLGRLEVGLRADLAVFGRAGPDPYRALLDSRAQDVRLVLLDGHGFTGEAALQQATARNAFCETLDACGSPHFLCVQDSPTGTNRTDETYASIHTQLFNILEGIGYPADEQYHRGAELLELVQCAP